jgi:cyclopropane-fatty-acyl-phospholipid synthase
MACRDEVARLYDERFYRMWEFYPVLCEIGFRLRTNMVFQMQRAKRIDAVPLTRDYMVDLGAARHLPLPLKRKRK